MNDEKLGQEPAFACMYGTSENGYLQEGMSKRFYAACMAMQGLLSNHVYMDNLAYKFENGDIELVKDAYEIADELLRQENL